MDFDIGSFKRFNRSGGRMTVFCGKCEVECINLRDRKIYTEKCPKCNTEYVFIMGDIGL